MGRASLFTEPSSCATGVSVGVGAAGDVTSVALAISCARRDGSKRSGVSCQPGLNGTSTRSGVSASASAAGAGPGLASAQAKTDPMKSILNVMRCIGRSVPCGVAAGVLSVVVAEPYIGQDAAAACLFDCMIASTYGLKRIAQTHFIPYVAAVLKPDTQQRKQAKEPQSPWRV